MSQPVDTLKSRAKADLDKLHQGLVAGLGSREKKEPTPNVSVALSSDIDVVGALQIVREAFVTIEELRDIAEHNQALLEGSEDRRKAVVDQNERLTDEIKMLRADLSRLKVRCEQLEEESGKLIEEKSSLDMYNTKVEEDLRNLVESIKTSFRQQKKALSVKLNS